MSSARGLTPCGEKITESVSGREVSSLVAVITKLVDDALLKFDEADSRGVMGDCAWDGGWERGGDDGDRNPLC